MRNLNSKLWSILLIFSSFAFAGELRTPFTALKSEEGLTPLMESYWKTNPVDAFKLSRMTQEDRNGDGKHDLWRKLDGNGDITELSFDTTESTGKPNLIFHLSKTIHPWSKRIQYFEKSDENKFKKIETEVIRNKSSYDVIKISKWPWKGKKSEEFIRRSKEGQFEVASTPNFSKPISYGGLYSTHAYVANRNPYGQCMNNYWSYWNNRGLSDSTVQRLVGQVASNTVIDDDCKDANNPNRVSFLGLRFYPNSASPIPGVSDRIRFRPENFEQYVEHTMRQLVQCLRDLRDPNGHNPRRTGQGARLAEEVLVNVFSPSLAGQPNPRPLRISCDSSVTDDLPNDIFARASDITQSHFPSIRLNKFTMGKANFKRTLMHEMLHLGGHEGHPHIHAHDRPGEPDLADACATCCDKGNVEMSSSAVSAYGFNLSSTADVQEAMCNVCKGNYYSPKTFQNYNYARALLAQGNSGGRLEAVTELRKAVLNGPNNTLAWRLIGQSFDYKVQKQMGLQGEVSSIQNGFLALAGYRRTVERASSEGGRRETRDDPNHTGLNRYLNSGKWISGLKQAPSSANINSTLKTKMVDFQSKKALAKYLIQGCADPSTGCAGEIITTLQELRRHLDDVKAQNDSISSANQKLNNACYNHHYLLEYNSLVNSYECLNKRQGNIQTCMERNENPPLQNPCYQ